VILGRNERGSYGAVLSTPTERRAPDVLSMRCEAPFTIVNRSVQPVFSPSI
jgi:hypothetical protein